MFSTEHFIWIGICAVFIGVLLFLSLKFRWSRKTAIYVMCIISIASELCKLFTHIKPLDGENWASGGYLRAVALPLHLCSLFIFVFFYLAFAKDEKKIRFLLNFFLPIGIVGALLAILMATSGTSFVEPYAYQCFVYHAGMLWFALYLLATGQIRYTWKDYVLNVVVLFCLAIAMIWINGAFVTAGCDTVNFFFVVRPPAEGLPFLNLDHGWYTYFAHLMTAGVLLETLVCVPIIFHTKRRARLSYTVSQTPATV